MNFFTFLLDIIFFFFKVSLVSIDILFYSSKSVVVAFFFKKNSSNFGISIATIEFFFFLILHFWENARDTNFFTKTFINC